MSKFTLNQLTEGIRQRHVGTHNRRLVEKWSRTGLLRGLEGTTRENMATLLLAPRVTYSQCADASEW